MISNDQSPQNVNDAEAHIRSGISLHQQGQLDDAQKAYRAALKVDRKHPDALHLLGVISFQRKDLARAASYITRSLDARPDFVPALENLAKIRLAQKKYENAIENAHNALLIDASHHSLYMIIGEAHLALGDFDEALAAYQARDAVYPNDAGVLHNIATCYMKMSRVDDGCAYFAKAMKAQPSNLNRRYHLAVALNTASRYGEALEIMQGTLAEHPENVPALVTAGDSLQAMGQVDQAIENFKLAISLKPEHVEAHFNLGLALLTQGEYSQGWQEYAWRTKTQAYTDFKPPLNVPLWNGEDLKGKSILLYPEQGMGDTVNFIRFAAIIKDIGARVVCKSPKILKRLLSTSDAIDKIVSPGDVMEVTDYQASMMDVPRLLETTYENIPFPGGYLKAGETDFEPAGGLNVGLVWQGNLSLKNDANRSIPLALFERLFEIEGLQVHSLQVGPGEEQIEMLGWQDRLHIHAPSLDDFADTAAIISKLDIVISVDTSVAHVAGAIGKPVWLLLPANADWRWGRTDETTPWYQSMRLFRQRAIGTWPDVINEVVGALRHEVCD